MKKDIKPAALKSDEYYMKKALRHAEKAGVGGEAPVGAVVVYNGRIIAFGENARESGKNPLRHAEITAIERASKRMGGWRLHECELYVTLEPCPMCAGAIINSRIKRVVIGAADKRFGCFGGHVDFNEFGFNHKPEIIFGVMRSECSELMSGFFKRLREKREK